MRHVPFRFLLLLPFLLALAACDSDDSDDGDGGGGGAIDCNASGTGILGANVGGEAYCAFTVSGSASSGTLFILGIGSFSGAVGAASLSLSTPAAEGTYTLGEGPAGDLLFAAFANTTAGLVYEAGSERGSGTIVVTDLTETTAQGTFSFVLEEFNENTDTYTGETLTVTDGEFDITLTEF